MAAPAPENQPTLFIRNIPYSATAQELSAYFERFGAIERATILQDRYHGKIFSRGIGFVGFKEQKSLDDALASQEEHNLKGRRLILAQARPPRPKKHDAAFIRGIPAETTPEQLKQTFAQYNPTNAKIIKFNTENSLGFGFIQFPTSEMQTKAVQENKVIQLNGGESHVAFAKYDFEGKRPTRRFRRFPKKFHRAPRPNKA